ncbi:hypothetical protein Tco_1543315, partial [Tanacetum coccineum]
MKEQDLIRRIQRNPIRSIQVIECEDSGRYQMWSLLQETPDTPIKSLLEVTAAKVCVTAAKHKLVL